MQLLRVLIAEQKVPVLYYAKNLKLGMYVIFIVKVETKQLKLQKETFKVHTGIREVIARCHTKVSCHGS